MKTNIKFDKKTIINIVCIIISVLLVICLTFVLSGFAITKSINKNLSNEKIEKAIDDFDIQKLIEDASFYDEVDDGSITKQLNLKSDDYKQLISRYKESGLTLGEEITIMLKEKLSDFTDTSEMNTLEDVANYIINSGQFEISEEDNEIIFEGNKIVGENNDVINGVLSSNYKGLLKIIKSYAIRTNSIAMIFTGNAASNILIIVGVLMILDIFAAQRSFIKAFPWIAASFIVAALMLLVFSTAFSIATTSLVVIPTVWESVNQLLQPITADLTTFTLAYFIIPPVLIGLRIYLPRVIEKNKETL